MRMRSLLALFFVVATSMASAQDIGGLDDGSSLPQTMKSSGLTSNFKAFKIKVQGGSGGLMDLMAAPMMMMGGIFGAMGGAQDKSEQEGMGLMTAIGLCWSTGETRVMFGQRFLVTYKLDMDFTDMMKMDATKNRDISNTDLRLELVRTDAIVSIMPRGDITPSAFMQMLRLPAPSKPAEAPAPAEEPKSPPKA